MLPVQGAHRPRVFCALYKRTAQWAACLFYACTAHARVARMPGAHADACCTRLHPTRVLLTQIRWTCCLHVPQRQRCCIHRTRICAVRTRTPQTCYTRALNCTPIYYKPAARICYTHAATIYTLHIHTCCVQMLRIHTYTLYAWHINAHTYAAHSCRDSAHTHISI